MSQSIKVGDTVERIEGGKSDFPKGEQGVVTYVSDENVNVRKSNGNVSKNNAPYKLRVINRTCDKTKGKPMLKTLNNFMKRALDSKYQALYKAGYINGDLLPTDEGIEALHAILFVDNIDALVTSANEHIAEVEAEDEE